jgi:nitric oxide reductase subunit B
MNTLRSLRVIGDTIFAAGILALGWFVLGLKTGWSLTNEPESLHMPAYRPSPKPET